MKRIEFRDDNAGIKVEAEEGLLSYVAKLSQRRGELSYIQPSDALILSENESVYQEVQQILGRKTSSCKRGVVIGIGGSSLGARAVYEALENDASCRLTFLDTVDGNALEHAHQTIIHTCAEKEEFFILLVSKSGETTESLANFEMLYGLLKKEFGDISDRVCVVTQNRSALWKEGHEQGYTVLEIPSVIDGRFSIFSVAGIAPLTLAGFDVQKLLAGARDMADKCFSSDKENNVAYRWAYLQAQHYQKGVQTSNTFFFSPRLEGLGRWYRELLAESINKTVSREGKKEHITITPIISLGSVDLHAMVPRFIDGEKDVFTTFVRSREASAELIPSVLNNESIEEGKSFEEIMDALYEGTLRAYREHALPFGEVIMDQIDAYVLGAWMQWKMHEVVYLGYMLEVDPFTEPAVESYKKYVRQILSDE